MQIKIDEQGYISEFAIIGELMGDSIDVEAPDDPEFMFKYGSYKYENGQLIYDVDKHGIIERAKHANELRVTRKKECFPIINRGVLWYNTLTEDQAIELSQWYQDWLDVTNTLVVPTMPEWLK